MSIKSGGTQTDQTHEHEHSGSDSEAHSPSEVAEISLSLANWEQWGLSMEEYHHSMQLFESNPNGKPLGHL